MIEHTIQDNAHSPSVRLLHQMNKELIACLQIFLIRHARDVAGSVLILAVALPQKVSGILHDLPIMRIHVIIVLDVVFMV